jgi:hypothetical protein
MGTPKEKKKRCAGSTKSFNRCGFTRLLKAETRGSLLQAVVVAAAAVLAVVSKFATRARKKPFAPQTEALVLTLLPRFFTTLKRLPLQLLKHLVYNRRRFPAVSLFHFFWSFLTLSKLTVNITVS